MSRIKLNKSWHFTGVKVSMHTSTCFFVPFRERERERERERKGGCDYSRSINLNHKILPFYIKVCFTPSFLRVCICSLPLLRLTDNCTCPQNVRTKGGLDTQYIYTGKQGQRCRNKFNLFDIATTGWTILTRNVFSFRPLQNIYHYNSSWDWMKISYKI